MELDSNVVHVRLRWTKEQHDLRLDLTDTVGDLKSIIWSLTNVVPHRQKLLGLTKSIKPLQDETTILELGLLPNVKAKEFMMIGTPEGEELGAASNEGPFESEEAGDVEYSATEIATFKAAQLVRNRRKLAEASALFGSTVSLMRPLRVGKPLLVLDLDYCILDTQRWKEESFSARDFARPYLHELLQAVSPHYDIAIWSQTSWRWLESKLIELSLIGDISKDYSIVFVLDRTLMPTVYSEKRGVAHKHQCKPLEVIWNNHPQYTARNTIAIDDLSKNFVFNIGQGLKIKAYKNSQTTRATDKELVYLKNYLLQIKSLDFTKLDHRQFKQFVGHPPAS